MFSSSINILWVIEGQFILDFLPLLIYYRFQSHEDDLLPFTSEFDRMNFYFS